MNDPRTLRRLLLPLRGGLTGTPDERAAVLLERARARNDERLQEALLQLGAWHAANISPVDRVVVELAS